MGCKPAVKGTRNPTSHGGPIKTYRGPSAGVEPRTDLGERQREPDDGAMFFTWRATVWCTMSYSDERDDLTSNKMDFTWKTRTGIEADAWGGSQVCRCPRDTLSLKSGNMEPLPSNQALEAQKGPSTRNRSCRSLNLPILPQRGH